MFLPVILAFAADFVVKGAAGSVIGVRGTDWAGSAAYPGPPDRHRAVD